MEFNRKCINKDKDKTGQALLILLNTHFVQVSEVSFFYLCVFYYLSLYLFCVSSLSLLPFFSHPFCRFLSLSSCTFIFLLFCFLLSSSLFLLASFSASSCSLLYSILFQPYVVNIHYFRRAENGETELSAAYTILQVYSVITLSGKLWLSITSISVVYKNNTPKK